MPGSVEVNITDILPDFINLMKGGYGDRVFSHSMAAVKQVGLLYQQVWRKYASGEMVVPGKPPINSKGDYTRSIKLDDSKVNVVSVYTDFEHHRRIEEGHDAIDLKPGLLKGPKARQGKNGPYNIVAFRHGIPGSDKQRNNPMVARIYNLLKKETDTADALKLDGLSNARGTSKITGKSPDAKGVERNTYNWGARISKLDQTNKRDNWKSGKYASMVRMQTSTGGAKSSSYITFRVVSIASDPQSWIVPARPGIPIRQATVDFARPMAIEILRGALEKDIS